MRLLIVALFIAVSSVNASGQESPLAKLTITKTRLRCSSGIAEVTYAYKRDKRNASALPLEFIVIQTAKHHMFKSCVHLSSKVDDVTPPAYIALEDWPIDLPHDDQIHVVTAGRYYTADSDVTLGEIRGWLDQPQLQATIKSLLDYKTKSRTARRKTDG